jgi:hypothetical protein
MDKIANEPTEEMDKIANDFKSALQDLFSKREFSIIDKQSKGSIISMTWGKGRKIDQVSYFVARGSPPTYFSRGTREDANRVLNSEDSIFGYDELNEFISEIEQE